MLVGTEMNLKALNRRSTTPFMRSRDGKPSVGDEAEYIIVFQSGRMFVTGGQDDSNTLRDSIRKGQVVHGSYYGSDDAAWQDTQLFVSQIESIIDLRTDSTGEEK